jgi:ABC-type Fe3+/spermidine/putrescine transport system ATPase subunit
VVLKDGRILQKGDAESIYKRPKNEYTAGLLGNYNLIIPTESIFSKYLSSKGRRPIIVRPESFKVHLKQKRGIQGKVVTVKYYGTHDEAIVNCSGEQIMVNTEPFLVKPGKRVYVSLQS